VRRGQAKQDGFSLIELMIALTVLIIGVTGIMTLQTSSMQASAYSRHATEASVLAEDWMETLRTIPIAGLANGNEKVNAQGFPDAAGLFTRTWTVVNDGTNLQLTITASWLERGNEAHAITYRTTRTP
jgi:prepilin-type N-terminal cleavage/methylation domain-containing protein